MKMMTRWIAGLALASLLPIAAHAADDPFLGTWRFNPAKSTLPAELAKQVKSKEFVFAPTADGVMVTETLELTSANGKKQVSHLPYAYGKFTPQTGAGLDAFSVVKTGTNTALWTTQLKGKDISKLQVDVSSDGKEMTFRYLSSAADPTGRVTQDRYVYDRQ